MNSLDLMKAFAVANDTWEEEKKKEEEKEELIPLHIPDPIPWANCEDSWWFFNSLDEIAEMKISCNASNWEIAEKFQISIRSVPRLIK